MARRSFRSDGNCVDDGGINHGRGVRHDPAALAVAEAVDKGPDGPLDDGRGRKGQEAHGRPHHLAPARVARRPALHAYRDSDAEGHVTARFGVMIGGFTSEREFVKDDRFGEETQRFGVGR